jgi:CRP-like cAMP-binding protein
MIAIIRVAARSTAGMTEGNLWSISARHSPLIAALPMQLRPALRQRHVAAGDNLFRRGERPNALYFVLTGEIHLVRRSRAGHEIILQRTRRGFLAEASLDQPAYHCDGIARCSTDTLRLPKATLRSALEDETFRNSWIEHLTRELRRVRAQAERLSLRSARERIVHYIETEGADGRIELTGTRRDWASELGLTHEALYRALAMMQKAGELKVADKVVTLADGAGADIA